MKTPRGAQLDQKEKHNEDQADEPDQPGGFARYAAGHDRQDPHQGRPEDQAVVAAKSRTKPMATRREHTMYESAVRLHNRAAECQAAGHPVRPEKLYIRSLELKERLFGGDHIEVAMTLNNLGLHYKS